MVADAFHSTEALQTTTTSGVCLLFLSGLRSGAADTAAIFMTTRMQRDKVDERTCQAMTTTISSTGLKLVEYTFRTWDFFFFDA
jgi:hypothetical protein